ncbi:hypothetical protein M422DRAFT_166116, partial [Sphaerobolus stellatus SS14]
IKMLSSILWLSLSATVALAATGVTTFNNYDSQGGVACSGFTSSNSQGNNIFAAALADGSPLWTGAKCQGSKDASKCNGKGACTNCTGPACPNEGQCGAVGLFIHLSCTYFIHV